MLTNVENVEPDCIFWIKLALLISIGGEAAKEGRRSMAHLDDANQKESHS